MSIGTYDPPAAAVAFAFTRAGGKGP
jgi:hypothetical protein